MGVEEGRGESRLWGDAGGIDDMIDTAIAGDRELENQSKLHKTIKTSCTHFVRSENITEKKEKSKRRKDTEGPASECHVDIGE